MYNFSSFITLVGLIILIVICFIYDSIPHFLNKDLRLIYLDRDYEIYHPIDLYSIGPIMKLGFLHMRKSGGTHFDTIINEFMMENYCINKSERVGVRGIRDGVPLDMLRKKNYTKPTKCPRVNYIHEETTCLEGLIAMRLPFRGHREDATFSLLTTLRDPIERIGSQAFYGANSIGHKILIEKIISNPSVNCGYFRNLSNKEKNSLNPTSLSGNCKDLTKSDRDHKCACFRETMQSTMDIIKVNETIWFNWIKTNVGYNDQYMSNYFVRRLVRRTSKIKPPNTLVKLFNESLDCLSFPFECKKKDQYEILKNTFPVYGLCSSINDPNYDIDEALKIAKYLLKFQFDFVIMEFFDQPRTLGALTKALNNPLNPSKSFMETKDNGGMVSSYDQSKDVKSKELNETFVKPSNSKNNSNSDSIFNKRSPKARRLLSKKEVSVHHQSNYRSNMPASVISYLEKDNAADIELYKFAVEEFNLRFKLEKWEEIV